MTTLSHWSHSKSAFILALLSAVVFGGPALASGKDNAGESNRSLDGDVVAAYSSGKYGALRSTDIESITPELYWSIFDTTTLSLSVPYLIQNAPRGTVGNGGNGHGNSANAHSGKNRGKNNPSVTTSGIGDVAIGIDQDLLKQSSSLPFDLGAFAEVKFGTADVGQGLGSGKNDYTFGGRAGHGWSAYYLSAEAGYVLVGNPGQVSANGVSTILDYHNAAFGSLHGTMDVNKATKVGLGYSVSESYERGTQAAQVVSADVSYALTHTIRLKGEVLAGLNNESPDLGVRLTLGIPL